MGGGKTLTIRPTCSRLLTVMMEEPAAHLGPGAPLVELVVAVMGMVGGRPTVADLSASLFERRARIAYAVAPEEAAGTLGRTPRIEGDIAGVDAKPRRPCVAVEAVRIPEANPAS